MSSPIRTPNLVRLRYVFMAIHSFLWLVTFILSVALTWTIPFIGVYAGAGLALIIYLPAAFILSRRDSASTFDHAGGEVAYLVIQMFATYGGGITAIMWNIVDETCYDAARYKEPHWIRCYVYLVLGGISLLEALILTVWFGIVVHKALHHPGMKPIQAYRIPTHRLLAGRTGGTVDKGDDTEMQYPFSARGAREENPPTKHRAGTPDSTVAMEKKLSREEITALPYAT